MSFINVYEEKIDEQLTYNLLFVDNCYCYSTSNYCITIMDGSMEITTNNTFYSNKTKLINETI